MHLKRTRGLRKGWLTHKCRRQQAAHMSSCTIHSCFHLLLLYVTRAAGPSTAAFRAGVYPEQVEGLRTRSYGMAGNRTLARGFQPIPTNPANCYTVRLFRLTTCRTVPSATPASDPSVTKCDTQKGLPRVLARLSRKGAPACGFYGRMRVPCIDAWTGPRTSTPFTS